MSTPPPVEARHTRPKRTLRMDWVMLGLITIACLALSLLQWRWTGEFAKAERVRLRAALTDQTQRMAQAFDESIRTNCLELLPSSAELRQASAEQVHRERYREWRQQGNGGAFFQRVAVVIPNRDGLQLFRIDGGAWRMEPWPAEWLPLKDTMTRRLREGGRPPLVERSSDLMEVPVFEQSSGGEPQELEWMIFELNRDYLQKQLLPGLVAEFLNPTGEQIFDAAVLDAGGAALFGQKHPADARADLFPINIGSGSGRGGGRRGGGNGRESKRWTLLTWHRAAGSLDEAVTQARRRNVAISLALIALLGGAGWALVRYTAKTHRLAHLQMEFVTGVSHDLRTPLAAIRGAAYNIRGGLVNQPESLDRYGQLILRNAEDLTGLIENLLAFAASKKPMAPSSTSNRVTLDALIQRAATSIEHALEASGGELEVDIAPGTPPVIGDAVALERMLRNLLDNAARHGAAGKWIGVTVRPDGTMVEIRVRDHGKGIAAEDMAQMFDPFYSGEASRRHQVRGIGLGLSLVKETVERHGGSVHAGNMASGGAEFIVRLPAAPGETAS